MEKQPQNLARRKFVKVLTAAGLSTALAHSLVGQALAQSQGVSDLDVLNLALTAEYLATDAYTRALTVNFPGEIRDSFVCYLITPLQPSSGAPDYG